MWKQEIHKLLKINQIAFKFVQNHSFFELLFIPEHQFYLHLIDIQTFQENNLPNNYFKEFSDRINAQNQRIIHLWEDVYLSNTSLVESRILAILGKFTRLHGRHCILKRIDRPKADKFLKINHLQGYVKAKFKYGLFLRPQYVERFMGIAGCGDIENGTEPNEPPLIAVATFSGGRTMKVGERSGKRSYELIRFASLMGCTVVGGMDKLLRAFIEEHQPDDIMSYADRDWSDGRSYYKLGYSQVENSSSQTFYVNLKTLERLPFKPLLDDKYLEIFNSGSIKFIKTIIKKSPVETTEDFVNKKF